MERYILDTCTWIEYFHERNGVPERVEAVGRKSLCASEVTLAELTYGAIRSANYERHIKEPQKLKRDVMVYSISDVFEEYGRIRCALKNIKKDLDREVGQFDMLIGATALHYDLTVVTDNIKHFSLMPGVKYENWVERWLHLFLYGTCPGFYESMGFVKLTRNEEDEHTRLMYYDMLELEE